MSNKYSSNIQDEEEDSQEIKFDDYFKKEASEDEESYSIRDSQNDLSLSKSPAGTLISKKSTPGTTQQNFKLAQSRIQA